MLNPEVGTEEDLAALAIALQQRGMGLILDVVPNHVSVAGENPWWADVLEHGLSSPYAGYFDVAWFDSPRPGMEGRLLLPVLGDQYGSVLESGQLVPVFEKGAFSIRYHDVRLPVDPRTYGSILGPATEAVRSKLGTDHPDAVELASILHAVSNLPPRNHPDPLHVAEARIECAAIRRRLGDLPGRSPEAAAAIALTLTKVAGTPGDPGSFGALDELLEAQVYRPCFWRVASDEINYRRFFDVNQLAALNTEREDVFEAVHRTWFRWLVARYADGLRIDHPDGLYDPKQYLQRLQEHYLFSLAKAIFQHDPGAFPGVEWDRDARELRTRLSWASENPARTPSGAGVCYVVVEKILGEGESLPEDWVCDGTTGYEFINAVNGLFVDPAGEVPLTAHYHQFTGQDDPWLEVVYQKKRQMAQSSLASELNALAYQLDRLARLDRRSRDFTLNGIRKALREVVSCFPVYRSYVDGEVHATDKAAVGKATRWAYRRNPLLGKAIFDFVRDTVLLKDSPSGPSTDEYRALQRRFAGKFQQVTAPVTAKGVEDTACYTYNRLTSLNEVGGEPGRFGWSPERLHEFLGNRMRTSGGLSPLSTHDTKRGEDVRARINVLSELPAEWAERLTRWASLNRPHKTTVEDGILAPDLNEECLLYQTLVGAWPEEWEEPVGERSQEPGVVNQTPPPAPPPRGEGRKPLVFHPSPLRGGVLSQALRSQESGVRSQESGVRNQESGEFLSRLEAAGDIGRGGQSLVLGGPTVLTAVQETLPLAGSPALHEFRTRIRQYSRKALAEAKVHTSWINPDVEYENAVEAFLDRILDPVVSREFLADLANFADRVAFFGRINSLAQTLLRCTAPGVPDVYQGSEGWDLSLVDPDNRRRVDYAARTRWLGELDNCVSSENEGLRGLALQLAQSPHDPRAKLFVTALALRCRAAHPTLFHEGKYVPLVAVGERASHVFGFQRRDGSGGAITVVPRLSVGLVPGATHVPIGPGVWGDTTLTLPPEDADVCWRNVFTEEIVVPVDGRLALAEMLGVFPVALLVRVE